MPRITAYPPYFIPRYKVVKERHAVRLSRGRLHNVFVGKVRPQSQDVINSYTRYLEELKPSTDGSYDIPDVYGQTVAIKDNFRSQEFPSTCASSILRGFQGSSATVAKLLEKAGASIVGKTNMDEFGMGSHSFHSAYGPVHSVPSSAGRRMLGRHSVGGSSGGSAAAVAAGLVDFSIGSDTGGSVRLPAAYTQTVGFKPSYGRISRNGLVPYANSLDTVGLLKSNSQGLIEIFETLDKHDPNDPTSLSEHTRNRIQRAVDERAFSKLDQDQKMGFQFPRQHILQNLKRCRIGVPLEYNIEEMHPLVRQTWVQTLDSLRNQDHKIIPISLPTTKEALAAYYVIAPAEASSNLAKYDGVRYGTTRHQRRTDDEDGTLYSQHRGQHFGDEVKRRILLGSYTLSASAMDNYFIQAQKIRRLVQNDFNLVFRMAHPLLRKSSPRPEGIDFIVCPTAPTPPPLLSKVQAADPLESYMNDVFTVPASLAGLPAISIPASPLAAGWPTVEKAVGIQVIGQYGDDYEVLRFANNYFSQPYDGDTGAGQGGVLRRPFWK